MRISILILITIFSLEMGAQQTHKIDSFAGKIFFKESAQGIYSMRDVFLTNDSAHKENPRLVAIALDIALGVLGMHRLYLGTQLKVPLIYTITLGGGGVLWLVDLGLLIFSKDISNFMDNPNVFMWLPK